LQDALADALFRAYFTEGRDIGKNEALTQIAAEAGLSATDFSRFVESDKGLEEVLKEEVEGKQRGLNGVPFFVINGVPAFSGAQHPETFVAAFRQVLDMDERARHFNDELLHLIRAEELKLVSRESEKAISWDILRPQRRDR
jgi:predicted DsbA family dithiol-disulfide isomerase